MFDIPACCLQRVIQSTQFIFLEKMAQTTEQSKTSFDQVLFPPRCYLHALLDYHVSHKSLFLCQTVQTIMCEKQALRHIKLCTSSYLIYGI